MSSIRKEKGLYVAQIYLGKHPQTGKRKHTTIRGYKTKKQCQLAAAKIEESVHNGTYWKEKLGDLDNITYEEMYNKWLEIYKTEVEPSTLLKTTGMFRNHFLPEFGDLLVKKITPVMLQAYITKLAHIYKRIDTPVNYFLAPLKLAFTLDIIDMDITLKIKKPKVTRSRKAAKLDNFYEHEELSLFIETLTEYREYNYKMFVFFMLLINSGMRKQEITALDWTKILFDSNIIVINQVVSRDENGVYIKDGAKNLPSVRNITMDQETMDILKDWKRQEEESHCDFNENFLVFGASLKNKDGRKIMSLNTLRSWLRKIQDTMDVKAKAKLNRPTLHGFRHTHVSLLAQRGVDIKAVSQRVGHEDITVTTKIYLHVTQKANDNLTSVLPELLNDL